VRALPWLLSGGVALLLAAGSTSAQSPGALAEGRAALGRGDVPRAVAVADRVLSADPLAYDALTLKIEALALAREWETALDAYDRYLAAGGRDDTALLRHVGRAVLREAEAFYPALRTGALGRLACAGDREALAALRRVSEPSRPDDVEFFLLKARLGEFEAVLALRELAVGPASPSRMQALQALQQLRDGGSGPIVVAALVDADPSVRLAGARAARDLSVMAATPRLRDLLGDPNPLIAAEAAAALATLGETDVLERLRPLLESPVADLRLPALAGFLSQGATPQLLDSLFRLASTRAGTTWTQAIELQLRDDPARAGVTIRQALADRANANSRVLGLRLLPRLSRLEPSDVAQLRALLRDLNAFVRIEAATVLLGPALLCAP
jgi:HEAT repeat protein